MKNMTRTVAAVAVAASFGLCMALAGCDDLPSAVSSGRYKQYNDSACVVGAGSVGAVSKIEIDDVLSLLCGQCLATSPRKFHTFHLKYPHQKIIMSDILLCKPSKS